MTILAIIVLVYFIIGHAMLTRMVYFSAKHAPKNNKALWQTFLFSYPLIVFGWPRVIYKGIKYIIEMRKGE